MHLKNKELLLQIYHCHPDNADVVNRVVCALEEGLSDHVRNLDVTGRQQAVCQYMESVFNVEPSTKLSDLLSNHDMYAKTMHSLILSVMRNNNLKCEQDPETSLHAPLPLIGMILWKAALYYSMIGNLDFSQHRIFDELGDLTSSVEDDYDVLVSLYKMSYASRKIHLT